MSVYPKKILIRLSGILLFTFISIQTFSQDDDFPDDSTVIVEEGLPRSDSSALTERFTENMDTLSVSVRSVSPATKKSWKEDEDFWYGNSDLKKTKRQILEERKRGEKGNRKEKESAIKEKNIRTPLTMQPWFQTLLWIIIVVGFTLFLILYLGNSNIGLFRKKIRRAMDDESDSSIPSDIFSINFQREIDKAVAGGNYRLAVRLHFLRLLRQLADKNIIRYTQDKTNFDYLLELQPTQYYPYFSRVTKNYEYSWYGNFSVSPGAYQTIKKDFDHFDQQLNRH